jgi:3-hydroxybutyryl-CoA dehydrogenase
LKASLALLFSEERWSMAEFARALVIGTGTMGPGIAVTLANGGVDVTILGRKADSAARGFEVARAELEFLAANGLADRAAAARLRASSDLEQAVRGADLVVESIPEQMELKQELFARLDALAPASAILASNTSGLSITAIASKCRRQERVLTAHFWNPPHLMPLVEIVRGEKTSPDAAESLRALLARCGKVPVMVRKDRPGQLGNRLQAALFREAISVVEEGIADAEEVEQAIKCGFGLRLPVYGPFEHMDLVGLDFIVNFLDYVCGDLYASSRAPELIRQHVAQGRLGVKSGRGFHDWSRKSVEEVKALRDRFVLERVKASRDVSS